jgi:hypothetical protein
MRSQFFEPYKHFVKRIIESCTNTEQLVIAHDIMYRFEDRFTIMVDRQQLEEANQELQSVYIAKQTQLLIH